MNRIALTGAQQHRAAGVLLATAAGDALGAAYEFGPPLAATVPVAMKGGGSFGWAPGEWTDDTSMALAIAQVAATGVDLRDESALDAVAASWLSWAADAKDIGIQTRAVFGRARRLAAVEGVAAPLSRHLREAARLVHEDVGRSGGNGSLMRTAPVALAYLHDEAALVEAARTVSDLTHHETDAGDACVLWCLAIRHAVLTGELDLRRGLALLPEERRDVWEARIDAAEVCRPADFDRNGWVVEALQAAWCAIATTPVPTDDLPAHVFRADHLRLALEAAVRGGGDTDTVAAIAGGLLGAWHGVSAVPAAWRRIVHGWPGLRSGDLVRLGVEIAQGGADAARWPSCETFDYSSWGDTGALARHPHDEGVWLGGVANLAAPPAGVDAVVSLCRIGVDETPSGVRPENHVEVWLVDDNDPAKNPHLGFVLLDAARAVRHLRDEGRTVLLHCVQAQSRTPTVAALYAVLAGEDFGEALASVCGVLPAASPKSTLRRSAEALSSAREGESNHVSG